MILKTKEVLPVLLSPIINSRCPLPIGIKQSIIKVPVINGVLTADLAIILGLLNSIFLKILSDRSLLIVRLILSLVLIIVAKNTFIESFSV